MTVGELGRVVGLTEVPVSRLVRDLVQRGVGTVSDAPTGPAPWRSPVAADDAAEAGADADADVKPVGPFATGEPAFAVDHAVGFADDTVTASNGAALAGDPLFTPTAVSGDLDQAEADEIARQLAMLSPRAAQAVRAAAAAETEAEREAALDAVDEGDDTINRGLLLKFLSTVKS